MVFDGEIIYISLPEQAEQTAAELLRALIPGYQPPVEVPVEMKTQDPTAAPITGTSTTNTAAAVTDTPATTAIVTDTPATTAATTSIASPVVTSSVTSATTSTTTATSSDPSTCTSSSSGIVDVPAADEPSSILPSASATAAAESIAEITAAEPVSPATVAVVGFDIEWRATFERGVAPHKAALLQLALPDKTYLFHIWYCGVVPSLKQLLEHPAIAKVGNNVSGDVSKMRTDYQVETKNWVDLGHLANARVPYNMIKRWSLSGLCEYFLHKDLPKTTDVRMGNWEVKPLDNAQLMYAATDAWVGLVLYNLLLAMPLRVAVKRLPPEDNKAGGEEAKSETKVSTDPTQCALLQVVGLPPSTAVFTVISVPLVFLPNQDKLSPLKVATHTEWHEKGQEMAAVAQMRNVRVTTVESYLYDAITAGFPYHWHRLQVSDYVFALTVAAVERLREGEENAASSAPASGPKPGEATATGTTTEGSNTALSTGSSTSGPPSTPENISTTASASSPAVGEEASSESKSEPRIASGDLFIWRTFASSSPRDCAADLYKIALGKGGALTPSFPALKDIKTLLPDEVSYSQIKFVLAHIFRMTCMAKWAALKAADNEAS